MAMSNTTDSSLMNLPRLKWAERKRLPDCPAIYFAIDAKDKVLYVGQATNLVKRWQNHHRTEQLARHHKKCPVFLAWMDCTGCAGQLDVLEARYIKQYQPTMNQTKVKAKRVIPAGQAFQDVLHSIEPAVLIFGMMQEEGEPKPVVHLRYSAGDRISYIATYMRKIVRANNKRAPHIKWAEIRRDRYAPIFRGRFDDVKVILATYSFDVFESLEANAQSHSLAGVELRALTAEQLESLKREDPFFKKYSGAMQPYTFDPIPL